MSFCMLCHCLLLCKVHYLLYSRHSFYIYIPYVPYILYTTVFLTPRGHRPQGRSQSWGPKRPQAHTGSFWVWPVPLCELWPQMTCVPHCELLWSDPRLFSFHWIQTPPSLSLTVSLTFPSVFVIIFTHFFSARPPIFGSPPTGGSIWTAAQTWCVCTVCP